MRTPRLILARGEHTWRTTHLEMLNAMKEMRTILTDEQFKKTKKKMMSKKTGENKPATRLMQKQE